MREVLKNLNESVGVRGSLVMTKEGVVVAACLGDDLEQETIAALASSVLGALGRSRKSSFHLGEVARFTLYAKHGRLIFEIVESLVLVVVTDKYIDLDITLLEIAGVAKRLQRMAQISV